MSSCRAPNVASSTVARCARASARAWPRSARSPLDLAATLVEALAHLPAALVEDHAQFRRRAPRVPPPPNGHGCRAPSRSCPAPHRALPAHCPSVPRSDPRRPQSDCRATRPLRESRAPSLSTRSPPFATRSVSTSTRCWSIRPARSSMCRAMPPPSGPSNSAKAVSIRRVPSWISAANRSVCAAIVSARAAPGCRTVASNVPSRMATLSFNRSPCVPMAAIASPGRLFEASVKRPRTHAEIRERSIGRSHETLAQFVHMLREEVAHAAFPAVEYPMQGVDRGVEGFTGCRDAVFPFVQDSGAGSRRRMDQGFLSRGGSLPDQDRGLLRRCAEFSAPIREEAIEGGSRPGPRPRGSTRHARRACGSA